MQNPLTKFIPFDKQLHFAVGFLIAITAIAVTRSVNIGFLLALAAGVGKELYDYIANAKATKAGLPPPHSVELLDAVATVIGGFAGALVAYGALHLL